MADNKINVTVSANTRKGITVSSAQQSTEITASTDTGRFWAQTSKNWAVADVIVDNTDYSSKYYATQAKESATSASGFESAIRDVYNGFLGETTEAIENVQGARDEAIANIETSRVEAVDSINSTKATILNDIEFVADGEKKEINELADEIKDNADTIINRVGISMFDTILKDHVLTYEESKGLALQGTWVYKTAIAGERFGYSDFYTKCLEEYNEATATETVNGVTVKVHSNGHKFYNITDKTAIDGFFNAMGSAWFYGVDTAGERIFLPRNNYFEQATSDTSKVGDSVEAGLPNIKGEAGYGAITGLLFDANGVSGCMSSGQSKSDRLTTASGASYDLTFNASLSNPIYGNSNTVQPNAVKKLLYICVGNTVSDTSWVDVVTQVQGGVKDIEEAKDEAIDELKNVAGGTVPLGFIGFSTLGIDETLGLQRCLNGQIVIQDQFKGFTKFLKRRIELYSSLACTEEEWQTTVTMSTNGVCDKFVIDDNAGTIRLPKYPEYLDLSINGTKTVRVYGDGNGLVLTDGTHTGTMMRGESNTTAPCYDADYPIKVGSSVSRTAFNATALGVTTNQTKSGLTGSVTISSEQIKGTYFIQVATGAETEDNIINEIELNNPFSLLDYKYSEYELNNLSWLRSNGQWNSKAIYPAVYDLLLKIYNGVETKAGVSVKLSTEEYIDYDFVLNTAEETFRLPILTTNRVLVAKKEATADDPTWYNLYSDGWCEQGGLTSTGDSITIDLSKPYSDTNYSVQVTLSRSDSASAHSPLVNITSNSQFKIYTEVTGAISSNKCWYAYGYTEISTTKNRLYFYVGETVQNANLINAGRIEEKLSDCITKNDCKAYIVETYSNGASGYNIYSNGYCEQWGRVMPTSTGIKTVTLLIAFKNTNYIVTNSIYTTTAVDLAYSYGVGNYKTNSFDFYCRSNGNTGYNCSWKACGYIA